MRELSSIPLTLIAVASLLGCTRSSPVAAPAAQQDQRLSYNPGGPKIPEPTTSISITVSPEGLVLPTETAIPSNPGGPVTLAPYSVSRFGGCTYTMSETGPNPCGAWNGIETYYPSTATHTAFVDCHGCVDVEVDKQLWYCGNQRVYGTSTVLTPTTITTTTCGTIPDGLFPTSTLPSVPVQPTRRSPQNNLVEQQPNVCPTTYFVQPSQSAGGTSTMYEQMATSTMRLPCGGCPLVVSTALFGPGQAGRFTATVTSPIGTATTYACQ